METSKSKKVLEIIVKAAISVVSVLLGISLESFIGVSQLIM